MWFISRILTYFAKPNFINYDEWVDDDLEKNKVHFKNKKIKSISKVHNFFYEQSNYKVCASENNLQLDIKVNETELINNNYLKNSLKKYSLTKKNLVYLQNTPPKQSKI